MRRLRGWAASITYVPAANLRRPTSLPTRSRTPEASVSWVRTWTSIPPRMSELTSSATRPGSPSAGSRYRRNPSFPSAIAATCAS